MNPNTPLKVLVERTKATTEVATKIEEAKSICTKAVEQVSHSWEALIEDE